MDQQTNRRVVCRRAIDEERLRALPEADRCAGCTNGH
jgi:RNA polymerase-binding transcription factor DksA